MGLGALVRIRNVLARRQDRRLGVLRGVVRRLTRAPGLPRRQLLLRHV